jgi:hypothetical protein
MISQALVGRRKRFSRDDPRPREIASRPQAETANVRAEIKDRLGILWNVILISEEHDPCGGHIVKILQFHGEAVP